MHYLQWLINNIIFANNEWPNQISETHQYDFDVESEACMELNWEGIKKKKNFSR